MFKSTIKELKTALSLFATLTILTGFLYPLLVTGLAEILFHEQANGSLIREGNTIIGSRLIGQAFTEAAYFHGRPSATTPFPYNGARSSGSNMSSTNPDFIRSVRDQVQGFLAFSPEKKQLVPVELVTTSASGLDPDISPLAAFYQLPRIAKTRHLDPKDIRILIQQHIRPRSLGVLGEPRVNVLELNLALNQLSEKRLKTS